jgi:hypothetical protein
MKEIEPHLQLEYSACSIMGATGDAGFSVNCYLSTKD